jgi:hypothetical protein
VKNTYNENDPKNAWKKIPPKSGETTKDVDKRFGTSENITNHGDNTLMKLVKGEQ